jgi:anti-sigma factor RsiW
MTSPHLSDEDLERYVTGLIHHDAELHWIEQHFFQCQECVERMNQMQDYLDAIQAGLRLDNDETGPTF